MPRTPSALRMHHSELMRGKYRLSRSTRDFTHVMVNESANHAVEGSTTAISVPTETCYRIPTEQESPMLQERQPRWQSHDFVRVKCVVLNRSPMHLISPGKLDCGHRQRRVNRPRSRTCPSPPTASCPPTPRPAQSPAGSIPVPDLGGCRASQRAWSRRRRALREVTRPGLGGRFTSLRLSSSIGRSISLNFMRAPPFR